MAQLCFRAKDRHSLVNVSQGGIDEELFKNFDLSFIEFLIRSSSSIGQS
ncbi:12555_t:CDS:2 [Gigaspora margarita]|uniref:12555_t:CDS:1 n=1 Tax=Gigaspora margarita TaxID=4874 RepID=A0ABN7V2I6_GIGMA|nr:12555_t:CDS:2 [Gigaspora margarita]